jgi:hypothetical protein
MGRIRLVTRADDAGMSPNVDRAIRATVRQGIVRNISLLAPAPVTAHAAKILLDLGDRVDFGLHVCLTAEWGNLRWGPVSPPEEVPSLLRRDGTFPQSCEELASLSPRIDEMMREVEAQERLLRGLGFPLRYIDEHMGVGEIAGLAGRLAAFAQDRGLVSDRKLQEAKKLAPLPDWAGPAEHPGTELADRLAAITSGTYRLIGHPGFKSEELERLELPGAEPGEVMIRRNRERRMFADIEIVDYCETRGIALLRYSELA